MARERPAVVQSPLHPAIMARKPREQHLYVHVVPVQVVQVHDIGLNRIQSRKQAPGDGLAVEAGFAVKARLKHVELHLQVGGEAHLVAILSIAAATPESIRILARGQKLLVLLHHDAAGRAVGHGVYVGVCRH